MSRDQAHGGGTWAFPNCVWAPVRTEDGKRWPFWHKVVEVRAGDEIIHLRGSGRAASFVGYSRVAGDGFETTKRPPNPKAWAFAERFYRADLADFIPFHQPLLLADVFAKRKTELEEYFDSNKRARSEKRHVFFVRQAGRLQCLNGAYLSDLDQTLFDILFGDTTDQRKGRKSRSQTVSVETTWQLASIRARVGQNEFASMVKEQFGYVCCFPSCTVTDKRFLVAAHIARWSDNDKLRGQLGNGLCFCLMHDKAFELGLFTLDQEYRVFVSPKERLQPSAFVQNLLDAAGMKVKLSTINPFDDALLEHWIRVDLDPQ